MALYPPTINSSLAIQAGSANTLTIYYTSDESVVETFKITAINPRTGQSVLTQNGAIVSSVTVTESNAAQKSINITISGNCAQVTMRTVSGGQESISSQAVIFKLLDETITFSALDNVAASPHRLATQVTFSGADGASDELRWYQIRLLYDGQEYYNSDRQYPQAHNAIDLMLDYDFWFGPRSYTCEISYGTKYGVQGTVTKTLSVNSTIARALTEQQFEMSFDNNNKLTLSARSGKRITSATLYRLKDQSWTQVASFSQTAGVTSCTFNYAFTEVRMCSYRAIVIEGTPSGASIVNQESYMTPLFWHGNYSEDILLYDSTSGATPYRIRYNPKISGLKYNTTDVIVPTLGAQYPFVFRNGHQMYRTFSLGGLMARLEEDETLVSYEDEVDEMLQERIYRDQLLTFLYNDNIKLFSSIQEGDMLIKLSGVSLTPVEQLGRRLYSFTATATEVAACTADNLAYYGISEEA